MSQSSNSPRVVIVGSGLSRALALQLIAQLAASGHEVVDEFTHPVAIGHELPPPLRSFEMLKEAPPWDLPRIETKNPFRQEHRANLKRHAALAKAGGRGRR